VRTAPLFMDVHERLPEGFTARDSGEAHCADLRVQERHGVKYLRYWVDEAAGKLFCLVEAPSVMAAVTVHREAHRLLADRIYEVREGE
jgi:Protein of unknown function (DUF4242)